MKLREWEKYLKKSRLLPVEPAPLNPEFRCVAVIPACDELEFLDETLASLPVGEREAVLVVVNHPADAPERVKRSSDILLEQLRSGTLRCRNLHWIWAPDLEGGVGEARKLGMDACIAARAPEALESGILCSLDGDTTVEASYFQDIERCFNEDEKLAALSIGFRHREGATPEEERAIRHYEAYLFDHVRQLREAGSPYAFQTVGSAFAVRMSSYVRCGGMRVRKGGEDFYFLQAVAKTGKVATLDRILVHPSPRPSTRVPFGTGPAVRRILDGEMPKAIAPEAFNALALLLEAASLPAMLERPELLESKIDERSFDFLRRERFFEVWPKVLANTPAAPEARLAAFHNWFDGLKTLRFLHVLSGM